MTTTVDGPAWARPGLDQRAGRYPLAVEAPVLAMTAMLMPGLSTQTQFARYYGLYWALADYAERAGLDADACRRTIRRAELLLAYVTDQLSGRDVVAHGADAMLRGLGGGRAFWALAETGTDSYSPRAWGFWGLYTGPSDTLGTVTTDGRALRTGRHPCPPELRAFFAPLLDVAAGSAGPDPSSLLPLLRPYDLGTHTGRDLAALGEVFTASRSGHHNPDEWTGADHTRRASLRILARAGALYPGVHWLEAMRSAVAYGDSCVADPVLAADADRAAAWRGLLPRHRSVGAWRRLWAGLVDHVIGQVVSRDDLHAWVAGQLPEQSVANAVAGRLARGPLFGRLRRPVCPGAVLDLVAASVLRPEDWRLWPAIPLGPRTPSPAPRRHRLRVPTRLRAEPAGGRVRAGRVPRSAQPRRVPHPPPRPRRLRPHDRSGGRWPRLDITRGDPRRPRSTPPAR